MAARGGDESQQPQRESQQQLYANHGPGHQINAPHGIQNNYISTRHLIDSVLAKDSKPRTVCYFFFKDGISSQQSVVNALCCILHQLFTQKPFLFSQEIVNKFKTGGQTFKESFGELWKILIRATEDANAGEIICLFDAVDECENRGLQLIKKLRESYCHTTIASKSKLKFLLTSRPFEDISQGLQPRDVPNLPIIRLSGETGPEMEEISREIDLFIKARVKEIGVNQNLTQEEQGKLLERLLGVPNRTYLWVYLTLDMVAEGIHPNKTISEVTDYLPATVENAYDSILSKSRDQETAMDVLHIVTAAVRPLTLKEMSVALALRRTTQHPHNLGPNPDPESEPKPAPEDRFRKFIREICGLFVMVIDSRIYLLHQTAREFLVRNPSTAISELNGQTLRWKYSLQPQESHRMLAELCIRYLLLQDFELHPLNQDELLSQYIERHVLLDYSAKHWAIHTRKLAADIQGAMNPSVLR
ncbi:Vegetative incompatibility protein HET-E-1, partial [Madurella mycetomatis]